MIFEFHADTQRKMLFDDRDPACQGKGGQRDVQRCVRIGMIRKPHFHTRPADYQILINANAGHLIFFDRRRIALKPVK